MEPMSTNPDPTPVKYQAYLLRLWQESGRLPGDRSGWRFSLEDPLSGSRVGFHDLEVLVMFLESIVGADHTD